MASRGKESKLEESVWEWTVGRIGGERVRAARPAQLNPCAQNEHTGQIKCDLALANLASKAYFSCKYSLKTRVSKCYKNTKLY
jgi:hypothetical protein